MKICIFSADLHLGLGNVRVVKLSIHLRSLLTIHIDFPIKDVALFHVKIAIRTRYYDIIVVEGTTLRFRVNMR